MNRLRTKDGKSHPNVAATVPESEGEGQEDWYAQERQIASPRRSDVHSGGGGSEIGIEDEVSINSGESLRAYDEIFEEEEEGRGQGILPVDVGGREGYEEEGREGGEDAEGEGSERGTRRSLDETHSPQQQTESGGQQRRARRRGGVRGGPTGRAQAESTTGVAALKQRVGGATSGVRGKAGKRQALGGARGKQQGGARRWRQGYRRQASQPGGKIANARANKAGGRAGRRSASHPGVGSSSSDSSSASGSGRGKSVWQRAKAAAKRTVAQAFRWASKWWRAANTTKTRSNKRTVQAGGAVTRNVQKDLVKSNGGGNKRAAKNQVPAGTTGTRTRGTRGQWAAGSRKQQTGTVAPGVSGQTGSSQVSSGALKRQRWGKRGAGKAGKRSQTVKMSTEEASTSVSRRGRTGAATTVVVTQPVVATLAQQSIDDIITVHDSARYKPVHVCSMQWHCHNHRTVMRARGIRMRRRSVTWFQLEWLP